MRDHAIFGGCLRSEIPLPELPSIVCDHPDWNFRQASGPLGDAEHLGRDSVDATIGVECARLSDGFRLQFDDTGTFDIVARGRDIVWTPGPNAPLNLVRADLLGGVFSIALHAQGLLCLHGSAVALGDVAMGFLGTKGAGKSTLATAFCRAGASLVTDDMLPVHPGPPVAAWPAVPAVRLLHDSAHRLRHATGATHPVTGKYHVSEFPPDRVERRRVALGALYELAPVESGAHGPVVHRIPLAGPHAVTTLLRHSRAGTAIGRAEAANLFVRASDIVRSVPVYRLEVGRDFDRLDDVIERISAWHSHSLPARTEPNASAAMR